MRDGQRFGYLGDVGYISAQADRRSDLPFGSVLICPLVVRAPR